MQHICPRCRTERIGAFRYCRECRFDYDVLDANSGALPSRGPETAGVEGHARALTPDRRSPVRGLSVLAFAVVVGVAGLSPGAVRILGSPSSASSTADVTPQAEKQVAAPPAATPRGTRSATAELAAGPSGKTTKARVVRVIDGDAILVAFGGQRHEVRYLGVDTPATVGRRALAANKALVAGKTVILEADVSEADRSGRLLRYVWLQSGSTWTLVNLELVRRGFATVETQSPDKKYVDGFVAAEAAARGRHVGLWGPAPEANPTPQAPPKPPKPPKPSVGS